MSTDPIFFDTDCVSAFLWTDKGSIITQLYGGKIVIPEIVHQELLRAPNTHFSERIEVLISSGNGKIQDIDSSSKAFDLYLKMTAVPDPGKKVVGKGEASAMALAHCFKGILASNNFRDIADYVRDLGLRYITTGDIMVEAYEQGIITLAEAEAIWEDMLAADRWIGAESFSAFYNDKPYKPLQNP